MSIKKYEDMRDSLTFRDENSEETIEDSEGDEDKDLSEEIG